MSSAFGVEHTVSKARTYVRDAEGQFSRVSGKKCQTPGAIFSTKIGDERVSVDVAMPMTLNLTKKEAIHLEQQIHDSLEQVLAPLFTKRPT